jgi:hypothetical protein
VLSGCIFIFKKKLTREMISGNAVHPDIYSRLSGNGYSSDKIVFWHDIELMAAMI